MLIELILAIVSVVVITFLVSMRYFNLVYAKGSSAMLAKTDSSLSSAWKFVSKFYFDTLQDVTELIKDLPHICLDIVNKLLFKLYKRTKKLVDLVKGNRIKTDGGSVSLYLKNIEGDSDKPTK